MDEADGLGSAGARPHQLFLGKLNGILVAPKTAPKKISSVVFEPISLKSATKYKFTVKKGIKDIDGNTLSEDYSWTFITSN